MKKKSIYIILSILYFLFCITKSYSFLSEDLGLDLYKSIDSGMGELELTLMEIEATNDNINEDLKKLGEECEFKGISTSDLEKISAGDLQLIYEKIEDRCKKNGSIATETITSLVSKTSELNNLYKKIGENKTKQIHSISRIGLYSDGIEENSGFDLIKDIQEIDKIIFSEEIEYNGEEASSNYESFNEFLERIKDDEKKSKENEVEDDYNETDDNNEKTNEIDEIVDSGIYSGANKYVCSEQNDLSGLDKSSLEEILNLSSKGKETLNAIRKKDTRVGSFDKVSKRTGTFDKRPRTGYKKLNDNAVWPCEGFFCIVIDFVTYNHNLLGGGETFTIESVLNRSNGHLKKFANTSLVQSKMTTNFFELGLRKLDLSEMFHLGFQVSTKSPPLLDVQQDEEGQDKEKKDEGPLAAKNLLREYYKNLCLDYDRANSLIKYRQVEEELKTIIDSAELSIEEATGKYQNLQAKCYELSSKNDLISKSVDKTILYEDMNDFYKQFVEIEKFAGELNNYSSNIKGIIKQFAKKPVHK